MRRCAVLAAGLALAAAGGAGAQPAYPVASVTLVTHSSPGGGSDVFLRTLARHLAPRMGVAFGRRGTPDEIAGAVRFLAGPGARYITGQTLHVNGGAYLA